MGCPAFSSACEETQAKHPATEQGFCKQAQASVTLSMGTNAVRLAPEPWPPGSQGAAGDSAEGQGDKVSCSGSEASAGSDRGYWHSYLLAKDWDLP